MTAPEPVSTAVEGPIATVTFGQPPLNLLSKTVKATLTQAFLELGERTDVRVVVLRGAGSQAFSAGADVTEFPERIRDGNARQVSENGHRMAEAITGCGKPVIAAIDGYAFGAGLEVALCADLRLASDRSRFAFPEVNRGVFPGNGGSQLITRLVGPARAKELMLLGSQIDARQAHSMGLVNRVLPASELYDAAAELSAELAERPATATRFIKRLVDEGGELPMADALELEARLFGEVFRTADVAEGAAAFLEKRTPVFRHR
ncbi:MAG TPA: enoyl-CoA hydratase-related protein [Pseudonocardiaceae bacterium]|nr:enoyl-CoA hydratase-related protein [Pseudonocardiaceae bacterium]